MSLLIPVYHPFDLPSQQYHSEAVHVLLSYIYQINVHPFANSDVVDTIWLHTNHNGLVVFL